MDARETAERIIRECAFDLTDTSGTRRMVEMDEDRLLDALAAYDASAEPGTACQHRIAGDRPVTCTGCGQLVAGYAEDMLPPGSAPIPAAQVVEAARKAINDEPEFTDEPPPEMLAALADPAVAVEALRLTARMAKRDIRARFDAAVRALTAGAPGKET